MSVHEFEIEFSALAQNDVDGILTYTLITWGEQQSADYKATMDQAFDTLLHNPNIGHRSHRLRVYSVGHPRIFYRLQENIIFVIRVLHERMESQQYLKESND
jgi:toxin ParE1/3/4